VTGEGGVADPTPLSLHFQFTYRKPLPGIL
jgi:hypothetical protein